VTIIEYSDLECPFCKTFHETLKKVMQAYPHDVRWVYRHMPIEQLHQQAFAEAVATECAGEQGKFWELTDKIFETTKSNDSLDLATLPALARSVGVANIPQFEACLKSDKYQERINHDIADGEAAGARGTPHSVIMGADGSKEAIMGAQPYATVEEKVKALLD
jgi:protein-disulfide isomerase